MFRIACLVLLVSFTVGLEFQAKLNMQWDRFKSVHGKKYTADEEKKRQEIFKKNIEDVLQHNLRADLGEVSYTKGINEFSDLSSEEFTQTMTLGLNISQLESNLKVFKGPFMAPNVRAPSTIDLRQLGMVTGVKHQGYECGSCWAFGTIGAVEGAWAKAKGKLVTLSEQHLVDCFGKLKGCEGQYPGYAMDYIIKNKGISADFCYPYTGTGPFQCRANPGCIAATIQNYIQVPKGNEEALKQAVANGPVTGIHHFNVNMHNYKSGIYYEKKCGSEKDTHAMVIVGYGTEGGRDYWLMKNSWGESWGERGYFKLARNSGNVCGISNWALYVVV